MKIKNIPLSTFIEAGLNKTQIAQKLNVHKSTITREIQRNGNGRYRNYKPRIAQERAQYRWLHRKLPRRFKKGTAEETANQARPYHSWERGSNENFNGLVRQYIPKGDRL